MAKNNRPYVRPKNIPANMRKPQSLNGGSAQPRQEINNTALCKTMDDFKNNPGADTQRKFIEELFMSKLLLPCHAVKRETQADGKQQVQLQFMLLKNKEGESLLGVFTDWEQIKKQKTNAPSEAAAVPFPDIIKTAVAQEQIKGILINAFEHGILLDRKTIINMNNNIQKASEAVSVSGDIDVPKADEPEAETSEDATTPTEKNPLDDILYIGEPLEEPYELIKELARYLKGIKAVVAAHFLEIYHSEGVPTPLVVIDYKGDGDSKAKVYSEIEKIYSENTDEPLKLTIMSSGEKIAKDAIVNIKPFYQKKLFGIF